MSINLTSEQQNAIEQAIQSGLVRSVDEFIDSAVGPCHAATVNSTRQRPGLPVRGCVKFARVSGST